LAKYNLSQDKKDTALFKSLLQLKSSYASLADITVLLVCDKECYVGHSLFSQVILMKGCFFPSSVKSNHIKPLVLDILELISTSAFTD
jgi:hypothetical protein